MKKLFQIVLVSSLSLLCFSCYYDEIPDWDNTIYEDGVDDEGIPNIPDDQTISFANDIQPIFTDRCVGCHGGNTNPDLRAGNSYNALTTGNYVVAGNADGSKLYDKLPGRNHFDVGFQLSVDDIALIKAWINQGAKNN